MHEVGNECDSAEDEANAGRVEQDRLEGEVKQWGKIQEPRKIRHARGNHSGNQKGYTSKVFSRKSLQSMGLSGSKKPFARSGGACFAQ